MIEQVDKSATQTAAEAEVSDFKNALGPFVTAAEATRMPMMFTDAQVADYPIIFVNQAFLDLTGYQEHEVMGESFFAFMKKGTDPEMLTEIQTAFRGGRNLESVVRYRHKSDRDVWVTTNIAPVRDLQGNIIQYFSSYIDITESKKEEDRLRMIIRDLTAKLEKAAAR